MPRRSRQSTAPFADAARVLVGDRAAALVAIGAAISCFGALNGWVLVVGQLPMAVAADGLFPRAFARLSRRGTPAFAMIVARRLSTVLVAMNYSRGLVELFTFIILLVDAQHARAVHVLLAGGRHPAPPRAAAWRGRPGRPRSPASRSSTRSSPSAAPAPDVVFSGFLLLMAGLPVYAWVAR